MKDAGGFQDLDLAISLAKKSKLTQESIANALGVSQSQISRIFSRKTSERSKLASEICIYVSNVVKSPPSEAVAGNFELMEAISSVWDGTPSHARALASVIRSLGLLQQSKVHPPKEVI